MRDAAYDFKFHSTLNPRLDVEIQNWHDACNKDKTKDFVTGQTVVIESTDPGETPLGGPMQITYDWDDNKESD